MISKLKVIFFFPPVQQVRVKLIVDFHTDIDFKLGKLRVGGRGMFSDRGDSAGRGRRGQRTEDISSVSSSYIQLKIVLQALVSEGCECPSSSQEISVTVWRSRSADDQ